MRVKAAASGGLVKAIASIDATQCEMSNFRRRDVKVNGRRVIRKFDKQPEP